MNKVFFFDIDGTLLPNGYSKPLDSTIHAIKELNENGHKVFIATGKNLEDAMWLGGILGINNFVTTNGQTIALDGKVVFERLIPTDVVESFTKLALDNDCLIGYQNDHERYVLESDKIDELKYFFDLVNIKHPRVEKELDRNFDVNQMIIVGEYDDLEYDRDSYKIVKWTETGADIIPTDASKGFAINWLLNGPLSGYQSYGFGDGHNDLEMFEEVNHAIAMGNSHDEVKAVATKVIGNDVEHGIYEFLVKEKLIKEM